MPVAGTIVSSLSLVLTILLVTGIIEVPSPEARREETVRRQYTLLAAIDAYRKVTGRFPPDAEDANRICHAENSMRWLLKHLTGAKTTDPDEGRKIAKETFPFLGSSPEELTKDAYGNTMRYYAERGMGGKPLILSAGPDGEFGDEAENQQKRMDNIRSDTGGTSGRLNTSP